MGPSGTPVPNRPAPMAHRFGTAGERHVGFWLGSEGYFFVNEHADDVTARGFDGVAFHPGKKELIIYDNKANIASLARSRANPRNVTAATAIDPEVNLKRNLFDTIRLLEEEPNFKIMPCRDEINKSLR